jgi:hypothetical protein
VLEWLESSALSQWVRQSDWPYPVLLDLHLLGLATVVGLSWVIDLRVLGALSRLSPRPLRRLFPAIWAGFALNAASGLVLFAADAQRFYSSLDFRLKLALIAIALFAAIVQQKQLRRFESQSIESVVVMSPHERLTALVSMVAWLGAIVAGRLLAYTT